MEGSKKGEFKFKQVIVLRADLKMSGGKAAAQACHASVSACEEARKMNNSWVDQWMKEGQCKIVLKVSSVEELLELERKARESGLPASLISDMGLTEVPPNTITALGIGPAPTVFIDKITGNLPLY
ncbi:MAG: peptidyl-tRNA hydrolase Pth2 [Nitrososphaerota archaeon]|nr:peptidyl-tRNA hydrolase Pth2 [Candidatus Bathyarchaeota archaeon]MDW8048979.1 peptidyl-tRNA hydrolase Pth2 [Nitrososphaerota archaeon]